MVERQLDAFLVNEGYEKVFSNVPELTVYFHVEDNYTNVFHIIYYDSIHLSEEQHHHIKEKIKEFFKEKNIYDIHIFSLVICKDIEKAKEFCEGNPFCWVINPVSNRLVVYENQVSDFYGMRDKIEKFLVQVSGNGWEEDNVEKTTAENTRKENKIRSRFQLPYVTVFFVLANILIFLICTFTGNLLYNIGTFSAGDFWDNKEYYRILTSIFLHWDINHLASNMIVLYYLGEVAEKYFGHIRFSIIYISAGLAGNLLSGWYEICEGLQTRSAGASGAIFGIIGAVFILVCIHKGHLEQITIGRLLFMILYSLYSGFVGPNINNAAHIGGFICGMAISFLLWILRVKTDKNVKDKNIA